MRPTSPRRSITSLAAGGALLLAMGACSVPGSGPEPDDVLKRLADAMPSGNVTGVDFLGGTAQAEKAFVAVTEGVAGQLDDARVSVGKVTTDGDSATGTLDWSWKVGSNTWSYGTEVKLTQGETGDGQGWLVRWSPSIVEPSLASGEKLAQSTIKAERGAILGAGDNPIVVLRPVVRVGIDKAQLKADQAHQAVQAARSATSLARLVDIDARGFAKQVATSGPKAFVQGIVYRRDDVPTGVLEALSAIPGGGAVPDELPLAPTKDFASAILGTVGPATSELVKESKGRIRAGDDVGLSGLQKRYDEQLAGTRGTTIAAVEDSGERRSLFTSDAVAGKPLSTTIDVASQKRAQGALAHVGPASALVAIRPSTGDLVAVASGPGSKGYDTATIGQYAPGSTFKIVSALALLRSGVSGTSKVDCPRTRVVDGKTFKNYDDYPSSGLGRIRLEDAFANSCNTAFIGERGKLEADTLEQAAASLGLGVDHDTGFASFFGKVTPPASQTQAAADMIGQGTVLASPMAMATVVASVVKGSTVLPRLLPHQQVQEKPPARPLTEGEAKQLRSLMRQVVERGSGALLKGLPGGPVIAKTGTAEFGDKLPLPTHAWMVAGRGDLAVAVFVERGDSGSGTAGPVLRRFLKTARVP
ncbi:MAG: penicillin-binding transpeptidase domain-containing protein [Marmoricola sp.]